MIVKIAAAQYVEHLVSAENEDIMRQIANSEVKSQQSSGLQPRTLKGVRAGVSPIIKTQ